MTSKTILSVGQCRPDHAAISHFITSNFDVQILVADVADEALEMVRSHRPHLILINRKLDADYSDGMEIIRSIKADETIAEIHVMLVSNYPDWQQKAVAAGALYGFGKAELNSPDTVQRIREALSVSATAS